jgi:hypothetical protein
VKKYKLVKIVMVEIDATPLTRNLLALRQQMEVQQNANPNDDFKIVDQDGNPVELQDFTASLSAKERKEAAYKELAKKRLKNCV